MQSIRLNAQLAVLNREYQLAQVLSSFAGLHDWRTTVDYQCLAQCGMAMSTDHHVDAGHGLGKAHVVTIRVLAIMSALESAVAEADDKVDVLGFAKRLRYLFG